MLPPSTYLRTSKPRVLAKSAPYQGRKTVGSAAMTDASDLGFASEFFEFLPSRVEICSQHLIGHHLPLLHVELLQPACRPLLVIVGGWGRYTPVDDAEVQVGGLRRENGSSKFSPISSGMGRVPRLL